MSHMFGGSQYKRFLIPKANIPSVLKILQDYNNHPYDDIDAAFESVGWKTGYDEFGNVDSLNFEFGLCYDDEEYLDRIAPFVKPGSYIIMENEDSYRWAWYFDGKTCTEYSGDTHYYGMPDHWLCFTDERDPDTLIPISDLKREYAQHILDDSIDPLEITFPQYLSNCMSHNGGTLTAI